MILFFSNIIRMFIYEDYFLNMLYMNRNVGYIMVFFLLDVVDDLRL